MPYFCPKTAHFGGFEGVFSYKTDKSAFARPDKTEAADFVSFKGSIVISVPSIADGDTALDGKISALNEALATAKKALEAADAADKTELSAKIEAADSSLQTAIDALSNELNEVKDALAKKDAELESKDQELQQFLIIVCIISCVALCGSGALAILFFFDRRKRISK